MKDKGELKINKVSAAILVAFLTLLLVGYTASFFFPEKVQEISVGIVPESVNIDEENGKGEDEESDEEDDAIQPESPLLASANPERGQKIFRVCASCHTIAGGAPNKIGPNLYGLLGRRAGEARGFRYSNTMKEYAAVWSYENLSAFIRNPKEFFDNKRINMAFAGLIKAKDRADLISFIRLQSDNVLTLPGE